MSEPRHNPWDGLCVKWHLGEPTRPDARCLICRPVVRQPASEPASRHTPEEIAAAINDVRDPSEVFFTRSAWVLADTVEDLLAALAAARGDTT